MIEHPLRYLTDARWAKETVFEWRMQFPRGTRVFVPGSSIAFLVRSHDPGEDGARNTFISLILLGTSVQCSSLKGQGQWHPLWDAHASSNDSAGGSAGSRRGEGQCLERCADPGRLSFIQLNPQTPLLFKLHRFMCRWELSLVSLVQQIFAH